MFGIIENFFPPARYSVINFSRKFGENFSIGGRSLVDFRTNRDDEWLKIGFSSKIYKKISSQVSRVIRVKKKNWSWSWFSSGIFRQVFFFLKSNAGKFSVLLVTCAKFFFRTRGVENFSVFAGFFFRNEWYRKIAVNFSVYKNNFSKVFNTWISSMRVRRSCLEVSLKFEFFTAPQPLSFCCVDEFFFAKIYPVSSVRNSSSSVSENQIFAKFERATFF